MGPPPNPCDAERADPRQAATDARVAELVAAMAPLSDREREGLRALLDPGQSDHDAA